MVLEKIVNTKVLTRGIFTVLAFAVTAFALVGCFGSYRGGIVSSTPMSLYKKTMTKELDEALEVSPLRFKVSFVADAMVPGDDNFYQSNIVQHSYEVNRLAGNATGFVRGKLSEALKTERVAEQQENIRFVSMDLQEVDLKILHGNFYSGRFGRYYARVEGDVRISGSDGTIYMNEPVSAEFQGNRQSLNGSQPSVEQDWHNMKLALMRSIDILALEITQKLTADDEDNELNLKAKKHDPKKHQTPSVFAP